jgi:hypothetical protein
MTIQSTHLYNPLTIERFPFAMFKISGYIYTDAKHIMWAILCVLQILKHGSRCWPVILQFTIKVHRGDTYPEIDTGLHTTDFNISIYNEFSYV